MSAFWYGVVGSAAVEVVTVCRILASGRRLPVRYERGRYLAWRIGLALIGGVLAQAHEVERPILAFHIGAATPAIIDSLTLTPPRRYDAE